MICDICEKDIPLSSFLKHIQKHGGGGNKHNARTVEEDGYVFRSVLERDRYVQLRLMQKTGVIHSLELQPKFVCMVNGIHITTYHADFRYTDVDSGKEIIEDTKSKSTKTEAYVIRKKLAQALFGIVITEVTREMM